VCDASTAQMLAKLWNKQRFANKAIMVILPQVYERSESQETVLVEPYLEGEFQKWNSNNGWASSEGGEMMQAFSHWTYHETDGKQLVCDLQGLRLCDRYVLSDPVVLTSDGSGGIADVGQDGMHAFFCFHTCNKFCSPKWSKISNPKLAKWLTPSNNTTFLGHSQMPIPATVVR